MTKTEICLSLKARLLLPYYQGKDKLIELMGYMMARLLQYHEFHLRRVQHAKIGVNAELLPEEIDAITQYQAKVDESDARRRSKSLFTEEMKLIPDAKLGMQHRATKVCDEVIEKYRDRIQVVANIGARVDTISYYLAKKYPEKEFFSIDLQDDIEEINQYFPESLANRKYRAGYPLHVLRDGDINADMIIMSSTATVLRSLEFDAYLDSVKETCKVFVFNEAWQSKMGSMNIFSTTRPESITGNLSYSAGRPITYNHNYVEKLESRGFRIERSRILESLKPGRMTIQVVATKMN